LKIPYFIVVQAQLTLQCPSVIHVNDLNKVPLGVTWKTQNSLEGLHPSIGVRYLCPPYHETPIGKPVQVTSQEGSHSFILSS
jgi:hypothetical protein